MGHERESCHTKREGTQGRFSGKEDTNGRYATQKEKARRGDSQVKERGHEREICYTKEGTQGRYALHEKKRTCYARICYTRET
jgi:hypothetical protein